MQRLLRRALLPALIISCAAHVGRAQSSQAGTAINSAVNGITISQLAINSGTIPPCTSTKRYTVSNPILPPVGIDFFGDTADYFTLPVGTGDGSEWFEVDFQAQYAADPFHPLVNPTIFVDGEYCSSCYLYQPLTTALGSNPGHYIFRFGHYGNAWSRNGVKDFVIRFTRLGSPTPVLDIRFRAVLVGLAFTEVLGYYDAPSLPLYILRDPPGDASFSSLSTGSTTCFGQSHSVNAGTEENAWYKAKVGVAGEAGLFVTTEFELYVEAGVSVTASRSETNTYEYQTCLEATSEFTTANNGTPDDLFIGSAIRHAYGMALWVERSTCGTVHKWASFASTPVQVLSSYHYNESYIIATVIPNLQQTIASMQPGTAAYDKAVDQLGVWQQALELNTAIKQNAQFEVMRSFNGGNAGFTYTQQTTTTESHAIEYTAALENGLSAEFGVEAGGTGITAGGAMKMKTEYGKGETSSNVATNTMSYHLEDSDVFDNLSVEVRRDNTFGTYVFVLDSANSRTSCRYEGGYALDQPSLSVGTPDNTTMSVNEAPIGSAVNFPLIICNNSDTTRTYFLRFSAVTNAQGAVLQAFGNTLNSNDNGIPLELLGGQCINTTLSLTQPNIGVVDFPNINLYLYSLCDEEYPPYIRSYITISAHFGAGNFGDVCEPVSAQGTVYGDFIDGVQLGDITNTGSGATNGPSYTDYSGQFSTPLSRGAQRMITITSGEYPDNSFAAWIDYDHDGVFAVDEKLGAFQSNTSFQPHDITFTVPADALLGSTLLRVRSGYALEVDAASMDACFNYDYGETEDYAVVIDANTPQDCQGVNNGGALPGTACNDNNASTGNDAWNANCACVGVLLDCAGAPGGTALPGTTCDDGDAATAGDVYTAECICAGALIDCLGIVGGPYLPGTACDDGDAATGNDAYTIDCSCAGQLIDCTGEPGGPVLPGTACDDGNPLSAGDAYSGNCLCVGAIAVDCEGVQNGDAQPGTPCDDGDITTGNDVFAPNCVCYGLPYDCAGMPGGTLLPGTPCDDANPNSTNDVFTPECYCVGQLPNDCAGVPGGAAQPGTPCDDGDDSTGDDSYNAFCECIGAALDCAGVPGGFAIPGAPCNDGDPNTGGDSYSLNCVCAGQPYDCEGVPGGMSTPGTACDDGNVDTSNDVYTANCICAGTLANDCEGVAGGPAQPGTGCDDGNAATGNDVYGTDCICAGTLIDCAGTIGGAELPGTTCDDADACTTNDVWSAGCACAGTPADAPAITAPATVETGGPITMFITPVAGANNYAWDLPSGWTSDNTGTFVLVAQAGEELGAEQVCIQLTVNGCVLTSCATVTVIDPTAIAEQPAPAWFTVRPNPSNGVFTLTSTDAAQEQTTLRVHDATGREVLRSALAGAVRVGTLDLTAVGAGTYYLIAARNGVQQVTPLVVTH